MTVLIIDDDAIMLRALRRHLPGRIRTANTVVSGIAKATDWQPSVIVLDMLFDDDAIAGLRAIPYLRQASPRSQIVVHSGYSDSGLKREAYHAGAVGFIVKGDLDALRATVIAARRRVSSVFVFASSSVH